jgi:hypothetical protein
MNEFRRVDYATYFPSPFPFPSFYQPIRNFARILGPLTLIWDTSLESFEKGMVVNSTGVFLPTKQEILQMMKEDSISVYASIPLP